VVEYLRVFRHVGFFVSEARASATNKERADLRRESVDTIDTKEEVSK
jgi:hypothetical protein